MRLMLVIAAAIVSSSPLFAQEPQPTVTPLLPISKSFGELVSEGYDLITIDINGGAWLEDGSNRLVLCMLTGNPAEEIRSVCKQVGK